MVWVSSVCKNLAGLFFLLFLTVACGEQAGEDGKSGGYTSIAYRYPEKDGFQRIVDSTGKFGYLNSGGELVVPPKYAIAYDFNEGVAIVAESMESGDMEYGIISGSGALLCNVKMNDCLLDTQFSDGMLLYKEMNSGRWGYLDITGTTRIFLPESVRQACRFENGKAKFITARDSGYINVRGELVNMPNSAAVKSPEKREGEYALKSTMLEEKDLAAIGKEHPLYIESKKILSGNLEVDDARSRKMILNYVEHLRSAYETKDIDFIRQLFSEQSLIIVGRVVRSTGSRELQMNNGAKVEYNILGKRRYIENLKRVFDSNSEIDLAFSEFRIMRHPTQSGIYGVRLRQAYRSTLYSDDGYLFLLWDFRDEAMPKIHVRTWQENPPGELVAEDSLYGMEHFNLQ